jgi:hypothetical protein
MEKKTDKNQIRNNKEDNTNSKELHFEFENPIFDFKEEDDFLFNENYSQYYSKKRNRYESINSFTFFDEIEENNLFNNKSLEKPKNNLKLKSLSHRKHKEKNKSKLNFLKKPLKKYNSILFIFTFKYSPFFFIYLNINYYIIYRNGKFIISKIF